MNNLSFTIAENRAGQRLDKILSSSESCNSNGTGLTRTAAAYLIEAGNCKVNGVVRPKNYLAKTGDEIIVEIPEAVKTDLIAQDLPVEVIYEDNDLLIVNKPRGLVVHPAHGNDSGTLVNFLMHHCGESLSGINGEIRPGIVHRIDKNTSGLLLVAKNDFTHNALSQQLKERLISREYRATVHGNVKQNGTVDAPIGRHKIKRKQMCVGGVNPRHAVTHYEIVKSYENATELKIRLETGRTHQIRVHMAYIGHPVMGDEVYGNGKPKWLEGQCLHARKIGFVHPKSGKRMEFESELPEYFVKLVKQLKEI